MRDFFNLMGFAAAKVGIKHQPFFVVMLEQHNALVRLTVFINGRDNHRRRVGEFRVTGLTQPALKQRQRFGGKIVATQAATGIHGADARFAAVRRYQTWPLRK
jgi:hypothetical protein